MEWDDIIYIGLLTFSILFGSIYVQFPPGAARQWVGTIVGLGTIIAVSGYHALHPLAICLLNILILQFLSKRWCHFASFVLSFSYLLIFRLCGYVGLPYPPGHTNAVQMMITLKLVGLCFEVHDTWQLENDIKKSSNELGNSSSTKSMDLLVSDDKSVADAVAGKSEVRKRTGIKGEEALNAEAVKSVDAPVKPVRSAEELHAEMLLRMKYEGVAPTLMEVVHYAFNYCGVLTGPYYKYRVYSDLMSGQCGGAGLQPWRWCLMRLRPLPAYAALFLLASHFFPLKFAESSTIFTDYGIWFRLAYMTPVFFAFRMRLYAGFVLSECVCIMAGLGAYPAASQPKPGKGPTLYKALQSSEARDNDDYNFETIHNIDEYGADFSPTVRSGMRCWNMTVQYWLATNVYRRIKAPKPLKEAITMLTSAFWHGMHSGYYLSMLTVPFILMVEDYYIRLLRKRFSEKGAAIFDVITWFFKMQWFAYMGMAFLLLRVDTTLQYWRSVSFMGHCVILILHAIAQFINLVWGKAQFKLKMCRETAFGTDSKLRIKSIPEVERARAELLKQKKRQQEEAGSAAVVATAKKED